jgi:translation initiation factor IF-3
VGVLPTKEALKIAEERDLDLVEVAPNATPPVCKVMDFGKYKYQMSKKQTAKRTMEVKEIKLRPRIDEHDLQLKIRNLRRFLDSGHKVKISMFFRGRERVRPELGMKVFERMMEILPGEYTVIQQPRYEGKTINMVITPK